MDALLVCAQRGDANTKRPNAPAIADAATTLHTGIAGEAAVLIVVVNRETALCSIMMNASFDRALGFRMSDAIGHRVSNRLGIALGSEWLTNTYSFGN